MNLRTRIALLTAVVVLVAATFAGVATAVSAIDLAEDGVDRELARDVALAPSFSPQLTDRLTELLEFRRQGCAQSADDANDADDDNDERRISAPRGRGPGLEVLDRVQQSIAPDGTVAATCTAIAVTTRDLEIAATGRGRHFRTETVDGERFRVLTFGIGESGALQLSRELDVVEQALGGLVTRFALFGLAAATLAAGIGWLFADRAIRPVRHLSEAAERVAATRDVGERIDQTSDDELGGLARSFNTMLESLDTSRSQQRRLVQDASHELRTPLTSIRTNVALLQRHHDLDAETRATVLEDITREIEELTDLSDELVVSATEIHLSAADTVDIALTALVDDAVDRAGRRHQRPFAMHADCSVDVHGDPRMLRRAIDNLLNNAAKFDPSGSPIEVNVDTTGVVDRANVTVLDHGPGLNADDLPHIFDRFYRSTSARSEPGSGLGLAIVRQIIEAHDGSVHAANRPTGGAAIGFSLPLASRPGGTGTNG